MILIIYFNLFCFLIFKLYEVFVLVVIINGFMILNISLEIIFFFEKGKFFCFICVWEFFIIKVNWCDVVIYLCGK